MQALLEREQQLAELRAAFDRAAQGEGRVALLHGEAGIGKSTLVRAFAAEVEKDARVLVGGCEALFTPRPLGPLYDIAAHLDAGSLPLQEEPIRTHRMAARFLEALRAPEQPTLAVFEDVHWADEATLDLVKFVGRRIETTCALLLLTYRDDELGPEHPLRFVIGDLPRTAVVRIPLPALSPHAVSAMAQSAHRSDANLHAATGGNPFFVTEVLAAPASKEVPESVRDAVLGRAARLSSPAREILDFVSVVPGRAERWLLDAVLAPKPRALAECTQSGSLVERRDTLGFRHELARKAILEAMEPAIVRAFHGRALHALRREQTRGATLARYVHHAAGANDAEAVLEFAPRAALDAARHGAHREAAAHYATALRFPSLLEPAQRVPLLESLAYECYLTGQLEACVDARQEALRLWRQLGDRNAEGRQLRWLSRTSWFLGLKHDADRYAREAVEILDPIEPPGPELAMALSNRSQLHMLAGEHQEAVSWGERAMTLAEGLGETEILAHALNNVGTARYLLGQDEGREMLERSLNLSLEHGYEEHAARAFTNLSTTSALLRLGQEALRVFETGIAYCKDRDLDSWALYMQAQLAQLLLDLGRWSEAADTATRVLRSRSRSAIFRIPALAALGLLRARRGDPGAWELLDEAQALSATAGEIQRIGPVCVARAEAAWLEERLPDHVREIEEAFALARKTGSREFAAAIAFWLWRAGRRQEVRRKGTGASELSSRVTGEAPPSTDPYRLQIAGRWQEAASQWLRLGWPYHRAMALADGDEASAREALETLQALGAKPAAHRVRLALQQRGVRGLPRGPRAATRAHPYGLTPRQVETLKLMAEGCTNAEIAARLFIAPKTVEHHVSAILARLGASSRRDAVQRAREGGLDLGPSQDRGGEVPKWGSLPDEPMGP